MSSWNTAERCRDAYRCHGWLYQGRRYADGTPFCVTYDFDSEEDQAVTVRDRDTMEQERIKISDLDAYFADKFAF